jgi:nucleoside-diphosphate-sugar epimerase
MPRTVLVTGASSQLGIFLLPRLEAAGYGVIALSRRAPPTPFQVTESVTWIHPDSGIDTLAAPECLVSCGPLELACELIGGVPSLRRVVAFSSSSVLSKQSSSNPAEKELMAEMSDQEDRLQRLCRKRDLPLLLLRPTMIYGCGQDRNVSLLAALAERTGFIPVAGRAAGLRQPVHADDLAELAVTAIVSENPVNLVSEVGGGSTLTYRDMASLIARSVTEKSRLISLPPGLMFLAVSALSRLGPWRGLNAEMVRRQSTDLVFDDSALREALSYDPRPFEPTSVDFKVPEYARGLQLPADRSDTVTA